MMPSGVIDSTTHSLSLSSARKLRFWRRVALGAILACAFLFGMVAAAVHSSVAQRIGTVAVHSDLRG